MADIMTHSERSERMRKIKGKDTKIEVQIRSELFKRGYRFRKNDKRFPGTPDIVIPKYKTVIFINGCFWHHHSGCKLAQVPKAREAFWMEKFQRNKEKDIENIRAIQAMGWQVVTLWECEIKKHFETTIEKLCEKISISDI